MQNKIVFRQELIKGQTTLLEIYAPQIAKKALAGNFIILRVNDKGERIPLTIADTNKEKGTITIVYLVLGKSTALLNSLKEGDEILDIAGPLGKPTHIEKQGTVVCIGGGTGIAAMHHIAKGHKAKGNKVMSIIGARNEDLLFFRTELESFCDAVNICTDDGSCGRQGLVTQLLEELLTTDKSITEVIAVGPVPMMEAVAKTTLPFKVKTIVSLNALMVDGIGMCGACRCTIAGKMKFSCVEGPEFDAHEVDFAELKSRLSQFHEQEKESMARYKENG